MAPIIAYANALRLHGTFPICDLAPELYLRVFQEALTLSCPLNYTCPHYHGEAPVADCTHGDWGCDHELSRPSLCKLPRTSSSSSHDDEGNRDDEENYIFWLPLLSDKFAYASAARMISRFNTVVFNQETLACFIELEWATFGYPKLHGSSSVPRTVEPVCHSEELRDIQIEMDFTWIDSLPEQLCNMRNLRHLTLVAVDFAPTRMMVPDFKRVVEGLPKLRSCRIVFEEERLRSCMHCGKREECELWKQFFEEESEIVDMINEKMERILGTKWAQRSLEKAFDLGLESLMEEGGDDVAEDLMSLDGDAADAGVLGEE